MCDVIASQLRTGDADKYVRDDEAVTSPQTDRDATDVTRHMMEPGLCDSSVCGYNRFNSFYWAPKINNSSFYNVINQRTTSRCHCDDMTSAAARKRQHSTVASERGGL